MGLDVLIDFAKQDSVWEDLYALQRFMFESGIEDNLTKRPMYYYERLEGGFVRPSFYFKFLERHPVPKNGYMNWFETAVQIQFFCEDVFEATLMHSKLQKLFAPKRDVILPRYDFETSPPTKISVSGVNSDGRLVEGIMGARILPDTITGQAFQEPDERWQVTVGFTMKTPDLAEFNPTTLKHVRREIITSGELPALILEAGVSSDVSVEES